MECSWWLEALGGIVLFWVLSLLVVWAASRRRLLKELARQEAAGSVAVDSFSEPRPEDAKAQEILGAYRRRLFLHPWPDTRLGFAAISAVAQQVLQEIARVYYPEEERPELKASLADLVGLVNRVGSRLHLWLNTLPMRPLKDLDIKTVLRCQELYQQAVCHPAYQFLKRHHLDKAARWLWTAKNLLNPWYWGRRAAYTGGREVVARLFLAQVVSLVGEEAIRIYSGRPAGGIRKRRLKLALQEMINLSWADGRLPLQVHLQMLRLFLQAKGLDDQERLGLIAQLAAARPADLPPLSSLEPADRHALAHTLRYLARACWQGEELDRRLAYIRARWEGGTAGTDHPTT